MRTTAAALLLLAYTPGCTALAPSVPITDAAQVAGTRPISGGERLPGSSPLPLLSGKHGLLYLLGSDDVGTITAVQANCAQRVAWYREVPFPILVSPVLSDNEGILYVGASRSNSA